MEFTSQMEMTSTTKTQEEIPPKPVNDDSDEEEEEEEEEEEQEKEQEKRQYMLVNPDEKKKAAIETAKSIGVKRKRPFSLVSDDHRHSTEPYRKRYPVLSGIPGIFELHGCVALCAMPAHSIVQTKVGYGTFCVFHAQATEEEKVQWLLKERQRELFVHHLVTLNKCKHEQIVFVDNDLSCLTCKVHISVDDLPADLKVDFR